MGPERAKSFPGQAVIETKDHARRAKPAIDHGRRGKGYVFGAFAPATGAAFTPPYPSRSTANWVAFLEAVEGWPPAGAEPV